MELSKNTEELDKHLKDCLKNCLQNKVEEKFLKDLNNSIFPCLKEDIYASLTQAICTYFIITGNKGSSFVDTTKQLNRKCEEIGHGLPELIKKLFESDFAEKLKAKLSNEKVPSSKQPKQERKTSNDLIVLSKPKDQKSSNTQTGSTKSNNSRQDRRQLHNPEVDYVKNLADQGVCLCEKEVTAGENAFLCIQCNRYYHLECMKRKRDKEDAKLHCSMCQLRRMLPNREVRKVLFMGMLRKSKRKHEFTIYISDEDLLSKRKLQVRSLRMKETAQNLVLFPDSTNIMLNNQSVKQFQPLHRQSSLKFRKDEPYNADWKNILPRENKVTIMEKLPTKESKEERIEVENHLIGFFFIEDRKMDLLIREISGNSFTSYEESKRMLENSFKVGSQGEELSCEVIKIPLLCTLTIDRIKTPARGIFCTHYQCFDLSNFMMMTSNSANPKWVCPFCKMPCYEFKVDCILLAILGAYAEEKATEVMFFKGGEFSVHADDKHIEGKVNNISDLPIDHSFKRTVQPPPEPERKRRKNVVIPENINVISLD